MFMHMIDALMIFTKCTYKYYYKVIYISRKQENEYHLFQVLSKAY